MTTVIGDVSDTALWVAEYRARETERPDALFRDPLARVLAGERGARIDARMSQAQYVEWSVVLRTHIIDAFIEELVGQGADLVLNLGAGLDTRPYRLALPESLRWVEVDFPKIVALKESKLAGERPRCRLERIALDLARDDERRRLFAELAASAKKAIVLTEGVTPYLSVPAVGALADDLLHEPAFAWWITDYNSPELMKKLTQGRRRREMANAPFLFDPPDWTVFFASHGWRVRTMRYIGETGIALGRRPPHPWWTKLLLALVPRSARDRIRQVNGYAVLTRASMSP